MGAGNLAGIQDPESDCATGCEPFISDFTMELPRGSRCLLVGANGAGGLPLPPMIHPTVVPAAPEPLPIC